MQSWENQHYGSIMLHGHLHDYISSVKGKILNVGYDLHGRFLTLDDIGYFVESLPALPYRGNEEFKNIVDVEKRKEKIFQKLHGVNNNKHKEHSLSSFSDLY